MGPSAVISPWHTPLWEGELWPLTGLLSACTLNLSLGEAAGGSQNAERTHLE